MKHHMNYNNRKFVLYVSTCSGCRENHIAKSNLKLHERMTLNRLPGFELAPSGTPNAPLYQLNYRVTGNGVLI